MFKHEEIEKFWQEIQWFRSDRRTAVRVLLQKLDRGGDISSIVPYWWSESPYKKTTLLDHTLGVVREAMKSYKDFKKMPTYQLLVIAALGHDISKRRGHLNRRPGEYFEVIHAKKSASLCLEWLRDYLLEEELTSVVNAVKCHHKKTHAQDEDIRGYLIRADLQERQNELCRMSPEELKGCKMIKRDPDAPVFVQRERDLPPIQAPDPYAERLPFFEPVGFLMRLLPHMNSMDAYTGKGVEAVSMPNDVCYVTTYRAFKIVREWGHEAGYGELMEAIARDMDRRNNVGHFIGHQLREIGALAEQELPPGGKYTHRKFRVITQYGKRSTNKGMFYIPIRTYFLGDDIVALEKRKRVSPLLRNITRIYPDTGLWTPKKGGKNNG